MIIRSLRSVLSAAAVAVLLLSSTIATRAQASSDAHPSMPAGSLVPSRITAKVDNSSRATLAHTVHPLATVANDRGALAESTPLNRIHVVLKRSDAQEASLKQLIGDLHNPASTSYHQWLTPDQFGAQFGPSDGDIAAVKSWLQSQGFTIGKLNPGHQTLEISGTAGQFKKAFNAEIHKYQVNGQTHFANASDPQIPTALAPVFGGFTALNNFRIKSYAKGLGEAKYEPVSKKVTPNWTEGLNGVNFVLAPSDFAVQYDLPAASTGTTGSGQSIAIINESNINIYLVNQFRSLFGLPANPPTVIVDGQDPGIDGVNNPDGPNGASVEAYLDVEWAGAVAPNATVDLVIGADTELESGLVLAAERAVYGNIAPIMSLSFGNCETSLTTGNQFLSSLWQQAAAQGITVLVSSGDSGSAGCDNDNTQLYAVQGQAVNGFASTPYNVAVGGTDFYYSAYNQGNTALNAQLGSYWNTTPSNTAPSTSILKVIPEQPWNNSQYGLNAFNLYAATGTTSIAGGSGGASTCGLYPSSGNVANCAPYPKPTWQKGTGVPADNARDIPDVSLFAATGNNFSFYPICATDGDCQPASPGSEIQIFGVGGTSASTPAFAGIMAMVNQLYGRQGQANFTLYPMATQFPAAFHDVTAGTNSVPCAVSSKNCIAVSNPITVNDPTYGTASEGEIGTGTTPEYNATPGYDLATGLGTLDAKVLLANWNKVTFASSGVTLTPSSTSFAHGTAITVSGAVTPGGTSAPTGTVALMTDSSQIAQQAQDDFTLASGGTYSGTISSLPGGTYNIYGLYSGDGINAPSTSAKTAITVTPETSTTAFSVLNSNGGVVPSGTTNIPYGQVLSLSASVTAASHGSPTGSVVFSDNNSTLNTAQMNVEGEAEYTYPFTVGTHSVTAAYSGDPSYSASNAPAIGFTVGKNIPAFTLSATNTFSTGQVYGGQQTVLTLLVENSSSSNGQAAAPGGTVTISGAPAGTNTTATLTSSFDPTTFAPAGVANFIVPAGATGTYNIKLSYPGDNNYTGTSNAYSVPFALANGGLSTTTTGSLSATASNPGLPIQLTITVAGQAGHSAPTGVVDVVANGVVLASEVALPTSSASSVTATVLLNSTELVQGNNLLTLQYSGDNTYLPSGSTLPLVTNPLSDFSLNPVATAVTIPASGTITDVVNVGSTNGFSGTVNLVCTANGGVGCTVSPAATSVASAGTTPATVTLTGSGVTSAGTYNVLITGTDSTGKYVHTIGLAVTSPRFSVGDFTLLAASPSITLANTGSATDTLTATSTGSFTGTVSLTCPAVSGITCSVVPPTVILTSGGNQNSVLTVTTNGTTPAGTYPVIATATSGSLVHTVTVQVTVNPVPVTPDFTLSPSSAAVSVSAGASATDALTVASLNTFNSAVALTCTSTGVTCSVAPTSVTPTSGGSATATLTLTGATVGTYNVVITGTSGTLVHTANVTVTVTAPLVPSFTITAASTNLTVPLGSTATDVITVTSVNSFSGSVPLSCSVTNGPATGVTCAFNPTSATLAGSGSTTSTLTLTGVTAGNYVVAVNGVVGNVSAMANLSVSVVAPGFTLTPNASTLSVVGGQPIQDGINVTGTNGFTGSVALACSAPSGITCAIAPASVAAGSSANLTITTTTSSAKLTHAPGFFEVAGGTALAGLLCLLIPGRRRRLPALLAVMLCAAALSLTTGCGGGGSANPSMNYNVTVTGTAGALTASTTVAVTVTTR